MNQFPVLRSFMRAPWLALCLGLVGSLLSGCEAQQEPPSRFRSAYHLGDYEANLGYSQSIKIGKTIYISMTLPVDKEGKLIAPDDMAGQLAAVYTNLGTTLKINGADFEHVAIERIYTTDMPGFLKYADQRLKIYSGESAPAASFIEVKHLADPGFLVGIEVVAELP